MILTLLSGGQDSTTCLFWARRSWPKERHVALSFAYGQTHSIELERAVRIAALAGVEHRVTRLELHGSELTGDAATRSDLPATFVPGRNLVFLAHAFAIGASAKAIVFGASQVDYSGYPDCRAPFIGAMQQAGLEALGGTGPVLHAPLLYKSKADTVRLARGLRGCWEALALSWTCYRPVHGEAPESVGAGRSQPCGSCPACVLRAKGFADAGETDPALGSPMADEEGK